MKVFLSYTSSDKEIVEAVYERLKNINVWYDSVDIGNGDCIPEKINEGLRDATHYVLFWSEAASRANWVKIELNAAFIQMVTGKCKFMIFVLDQTALPDILCAYRYDEIGDKSFLEQVENISKKIISQDGVNPRLSSFINRTCEIGEIEEAARCGCRVVVLTGILGIGKFSLAEKAFSWLYPNQATSRLMLDFNYIPGIAELTLELSRKLNTDLLNDNHDELSQKKNIQYFMEVISSKNLLVIFKDVKKWLLENGEISEDLKFLIDLLSNEKLFNSISIITSSRYINGLSTYNTNVRQIKINGLSDEHTATVIQNNLLSSVKSDVGNNIEIAKRLYGYPLAAKLAAYGIGNFGYSYYLNQPQIIQSLKVSLAKKLISYANISDECLEYLKIVALCKSKLRSEEYIAVFPSFSDTIAKLADEAFFSGITKFDDDGCYQLESIVEDYFYDLAFAAPNRKEICKKLGKYLSMNLKTADKEAYLRLVPVAVHVLTLTGDFSEAVLLRTELIKTIVLSMWDQYNHVEYEEALSTANSLIEIDNMNIEARYVKALCLTRFDKYNEAEFILQKLLNEDQKNEARYHYARGRIEKRKMNYSCACELFEIAISIRGKYLSAYRELAECYLLMEQYADAERCIGKALKIDENNIFVILLKAQLLQKQNCPAEAIKLLENETIANPAQAQAQLYFRKGRAYDQLKQEDKACECYKLSLEYNAKMYDSALCLLNHKVSNNNPDAVEDIQRLRTKLHGKRKAVLINIEARFIGYVKKDEPDALELLNKVVNQYRDRQWFSVKIQLLEKLVGQSKIKGRNIIAGRYESELVKTKQELNDRYGIQYSDKMDFFIDI